MPVMTQPLRLSRKCWIRCRHRELLKLSGLHSQEPALYAWRMPVLGRLPLARLSLMVLLILLDILIASAH
jgi:hypothetical protein